MVFLREYRRVASDSTHCKPFDWLKTNQRAWALALWFLWKLFHSSAFISDDDWVRLVFSYCFPILKLNWEIWQWGKPARINHRLERRKSQQKSDSHSNPNPLMPRWGTKLWCQLPLLKKPCQSLMFLYPNLLSYPVVMHFLLHGFPAHQQRGALWFSSFYD